MGLDRLVPAGKGVSMQSAGFLLPLPPCGSSSVPAATLDASSGVVFWLLEQVPAQLWGHFCPLFAFSHTSLLFPLKLGEMVEAEDALSEANALNNSNAEVWAYLALVCLQVSAQQAPRPSLKNTACIPGVRTVGGAISAAPFPAAHRCLPSPPRAHPFPSPLCCFAGRSAAGGRAVLQIRLEGERGHQALVLPRVV